MEEIILKETSMFVFVGFHSWSGSKGIKMEDIGVSDADSILQVRQKICPDILLQPFRGLATSTFRKMNQVGTRFKRLGTNVWSIPSSRKDEVEQMLQGCQQRHTDLLAKFSASYDHVCNEYYTGKEYEWKLRQAHLPLSLALEKIKMIHSFFKISHSDSSENLGDKAVFESFTDQFAEEAEATATALANRKNPDMIRANTLEKLFQMREKARGFAFLNADAGAIADYLDEKLKVFKQGAMVSQKGHIAEAFFIVDQLSDPERLKNFSRILLNEGLLSTATSVVAEHAEIVEEDGLDFFLDNLEDEDFDDLSDEDVEDEDQDVDDEEDVEDSSADNQEVAVIEDAANMPVIEDGLEFLASSAD